MFFCRKFQLCCPYAPPPGSDARCMASDEACDQIRRRINEDKKYNRGGIKPKIIIREDNENEPGSY